MPYRLPLDDLPAGFASLVRRESKRLTGPAHGQAAAADQVAAVHGLRKSLKRLRALILLADTPDQRRPLHDLDRRLRDLGRAYAPLRDTAVLAETLDRLVADGTIRPKSLAVHVRATLTADGGTHQDDIDPLAIASARDAALSKLAALSFDDVTLDTAIAAAGRTYKTARRARRAVESDDTGEAFHDWRKRVQRHARHMQLLVDLWPAEMAARCDTAKALAEQLGQEHDLAELDRRLASISIGPAQRRALERARQAMADRRAELRRTSLALGDLLFAERGRAFRARLSAFHRAAPAAPATKIDAADAPPLVPARRLRYDRRQGDGDA